MLPSCSHAHCTTPLLFFEEQYKVSGRSREVDEAWRGGVRRVPASQIAEGELANGADAGGEVGGRDLHNEKRVAARGVRVDVVGRHAPVLVPAAHHVGDLYPCMRTFNSA